MNRRRKGKTNTTSHPPQRLKVAEVLAFLRTCTGEAVDLVLELRDVVRAEAPTVAEAIRFGGLCYFKPDSPFGCIGGNVCGIQVKDGEVVLVFIHGAFLPDPSELLTGSGKALRRTIIRSKAECRRRAVRELIRAAHAYNAPGIDRPLLG